MASQSKRRDPSMAVNVIATNLTTENLSRQELLQWVNVCLDVDYSKVEEMCTGAPYCQFMDMLFPGSVPMKKIKFLTNVEHEFIQNFKVLQTAFNKVGVSTTVPIEKLIKGRFQDNFEFLQWFKRFFDVNYDGHIYDAKGARDGAPLGFLKANTAKSVGGTPVPLRATSRGPVYERSKTPKRKSEETKAEMEELLQKLKESEARTKQFEKDRDFYFHKCQAIEIICASIEDDYPYKGKILDILYRKADEIPFDCEFDEFY